MAEPADLIIKPQWILPIVPENKVFEHCAIAIKDGLIIEIIPNTQIEKSYGTVEVVDLPNQVVMPGLINAHGHSAMSLLRGYADDLDLQTWLNDHIWPAEGRFVSEDFVRDGSRLAIAEMIKSGTTCFSDMYFFPEITAEIAIQSGIRSRISFPIMEFPSAWGQGPEEYIHKGLALRDHYKTNPLTDIVFGPHAPYTLEDKSLEKVAMLSEELDARIQIHLHETRKEVQDSIELHGLRPIERMEKLGILGPRTEAVHMTQLTDDDIERVARYNTSVIHCPRSNLKLASGLSPIVKLKEQEIKIGLGTDSAASNNNLDMFKELNQASLLAKVVSGDASSLNAFESLELATLGSAKALGIAKKTGSLEAGKSADMISVSMDDLSMEPLYNLPSQLAYACGSSQVINSWVSGKQLMKDRQLTTLNESEIRAHSLQWAQKIAGKNS